MATSLTKSNVVLSNTEYKVVGTRPIRHDGTDKVTGLAKYGADLNPPGALVCKLLRSPHAHARIKSIDTSKAEALAGVRAVVTANDLPLAEDKIEEIGETAINVRFLSDNILASTKALYYGHAVAAVAAIDQHIAEDALKLIDVEYEVLKPVLNVLDATGEDAPLLHEDIVTEEFGGGNGKPSNVASRLRFEKGDVDAGFAAADVIIEREFDTATVHQGYIEPHAAVVHWNADGHINVWTCTQGAFPVRDQMASVLDLPVSDITVVPSEIGGGFGGKFPLYGEPSAALMSRMTGRPVKYVMSRAEVLEATGPTPASHSRVKIGSTRDGKITAVDAWFAFEAGAYPGSPIGAGAQCAFASYDIPNGVLVGDDVLVNKPKSSAYRAPGATQTGFAVECVLDEICEEIGMDPIEFRLKNSAKQGTRRLDGPVSPRIGAIETLEAAQAHDHNRAPVGGPNRGRGVAMGFWFNGGGPSCCTISVNDDGTVTLIEGSADIGGTRAAIAMQAAEVLGIDAHDVSPKVVDTDSIGYTGGTGGSRTAYATGFAAYEAAQDVVRRMKERLALIWETTPEDIEFSDAMFSSASNSELTMSFKELSGKLSTTGGPITGSANVEPTGAGPGFAVHIADVEVDPETGKVEILRYTALQDVGKAVHPSYVEGQMQGGVVQGIGWAINEEYFYNEEGRLMNFSLLDYRMPTALDTPMIDTVIVEVANPGHPYGVRGVGEVPIVPPPAAISNAIYNACGRRLRTLPMNPGRVMSAVLSDPM